MNETKNESLELANAMDTAAYFPAYPANPYKQVADMLRSQAYEIEYLKSYSESQTDSFDMMMIELKRLRDERDQLKAKLEQLTSGDVELPEPIYTNKHRAYEDSFSKDQMRDYGNRRAAQAVLAERQKMVGDAVVMTIQADLIREVANALSVLIKAKPLTAAFDYGNDSIGNLRVRLHIESSSHRSTLKDVMEQAGISTERINGYFKGEQA